MRCRNLPTHARGGGGAGGPPSLESVISLEASLPRFLPLCLFRACRDGWRSRGSLFRIQGHRALALCQARRPSSLSPRSCLDVTASLRVGVLSKGDDVVAVVVAVAAVASHLLGVQSFRFFGKARNEFALSRRRRGRKEGLGGGRVVHCGWEGDRGDQGCLRRFSPRFLRSSLSVPKYLAKQTTHGANTRAVERRPSPNKPRQSSGGGSGGVEWESESDGMRVNLKRAAHFHIAAVSVFWLSLTPDDLAWSVVVACVVITVGRHVESIKCEARSAGCFDA